jgi:Type III restriction enzyme, res subunit
MATKLTPAEKLEKKQREQLYDLINRVTSQFSFKKIQTKRDLLIACGHSDESLKLLHYSPSELDSKITRPEMALFLDDMRLSWEVETWLKKNPPVYEDSEDEEMFGHGSGASYNLDNLQAAAEADERDRKLKGDQPPIDHGLCESEKEKASLFWFQKKACKELLDNIVLHKRRGQLLLAGVGTGKTFIAGALFRRLIDMQFHVGKTMTPFPYIYVTKASIVEQTKRVFQEFFSLSEEDVIIINIEQLRASFGKMFLKEELVIEAGEEHVVWKWRRNINPVFILWDECQQLKNADSTQSKIAQSFNEIESHETYQVFMSATPFTRVIEAKCFCVATRIPFSFGVAKNISLTNKHWKDFAAEVAAPSDPEEHSPAAIDRLIDKMDSYIVRVRGVKTQFKALNNVQMIDFQCEEDRAYYQKAWDRYLAEKAKAEKGDMSAGQARMMVLVQFLKFRQAAELCRARYIARAMWETVQQGQAAVCAFNFKHSITKAVKILIEDYNVPRDNISLIWGGAPAVITKKKKVRLSLLDNAEAMAALEAEGVSLDDLDIDEEQLYEEQDKQKEIEDLPESYRLGPQDSRKRQTEIDRFQSGKSLYCFYTFRAGGVGLSLHHTDELTSNKVRHKESGYAVEEDIPLIATRQRVGFIAPTYSAIELVQGLGRAPRLTSLSDTPQTLIFFKGTIEERVAYIVSMKLKCLGKVVRQKESWSDVVVGNKQEADEKYKQLTNPVNNTTAEEDADDVIDITQEEE